MKIVLAGPPQSGKSCLREGLKQVLRSIPGAPYPYVITACPDGEGSWFQETVNSNPELAAECKARYKGKFTPEFVERISTSVAKCSLELCLVDIGGIPSKENYQICASATHIIILKASNKADKKGEWIEFARDLGLTVIADIDSDYHGDADKVNPVENGVLTGSVHYLERGENLVNRPMIHALARHVLSFIPG